MMLIRTARTMRRLVQSQMIEPGIARLPWLAGQLRVIEDQAQPD